MVPKRKLIEVSVPLEAINRESAREKSIRHGHPSTLHLWWARRPLAAARAVLFAQLVDDPSSHPDQFPTEEDQRVERERLHNIIERLVVWENIRDEKLLHEAHQEIVKSSEGKPPAILDPFAGGGAIPLEAQRLGLEAHASDLNPVAVLINKALIEIPPKFADQPPVFPGLADSQIGPWKGAQGLAADVRAYGMWMRDEAEKRIGHLYPKAVLDDGSEANVIAWIWARTVTCPNPACGVEMPLVRSWWLSKKKGKEAYIAPSVVKDDSHPSGKRVQFAVHRQKEGGPTVEKDGTVGRTGATCVSCQTAVSLDYIRTEGRNHRIGERLIATVAEGNRQRHYLGPTKTHEEASSIVKAADVPNGKLPNNPRNFQTPNYGMTEWSDLFTNRQLVSLTTFGALVREAREKLRNDGATESYADAVATYLAIATSRCTDYWSSLSSWDKSRDTMRNVFARQAIPMVWDFAEAMPLSTSSGGFHGQLGFVAKAIEATPANVSATVAVADASSRTFESLVISTDPPYYNNVPYSDLSDFFYVWLRRSLRDIYPDLFSTLLVPKAEELVANPYRHGGKDEAKDFFESGFRKVFAKARDAATDEYPITVWYAFKQSDSDEGGEASTGWETLLEGMIRSGWEITSTWPVRSELSNRMLASGTNALASSIVLSLRPREQDAPTVDRRTFVAALEAELPDALRRLQEGQIAPVDLPQAAIGPGMAVFSRYSAVLNPDGSPMTVRAALARINEILDKVLNEQEGDFDAVTRFSMTWYKQHGYGEGSFGDANNLANARNTTVDVMDRSGVLSSRAGKVRLFKPADLAFDYDPVSDMQTSNWEALHHLVRVLERDGVTPAGDFLGAVLSRSDQAVDPDLVKELAYLLFRVAEANGWTQDALSFNALVASWADILEASRNKPKQQSNQSTFDFDEGE